MAKVSNTDIYNYDNFLDARDFLLGTDWNNARKTKSFKLEHLRYFILEGLDSSNNGFLINNGYTLVDNILTINAGWQWLLNGLLCTNEEDVVFTLEYTAPGFVRIDSIYANSNGELLIISGGESETIAVPPLKPINTLLAFSINIFDSTIVTGEDPVLGSIYVKKEFSKSVDFNGSGSNVVIPLNPDGYSEIRLANPGLASISGIDLSLMTGPSFESPYQGKEIIFRNLTGVDVLLKFDDFATAACPLILKNGIDMILPSGENIFFKYDSSDGLYEVGKSWTTTDDVVGLTTLLNLKENTSNKTTTVTGNETSNILFGSIKAIVDWTTSLFVPKTRTLTIGAETFDLSTNRTFAVGGGDDYLTHDTPRAFIEFPNVGEWLCSNSSFVGPQFLGGTQVSCGTGTTPTSTFNLQAVILPIPVGYIVHEILVNLNYKVYNTTASTLQFFVQREETDGTGQVNTGSNPFTISNDTLVTTTGLAATNLRRIESLAINAHSLPSLAFSYLQIAIRETQNASYNGISLQIKFKKV